MQNSKTVVQTLLGETAHFGFCPPKIGFFNGHFVALAHTLRSDQNVYKDLSNYEQLVSNNFTYICDDYFVIMLIML